MSTTYCLLTGGRCTHSPISFYENSFFLAEPYDLDRIERETAIKSILQGYPLFIADNSILNISLSCKVCKLIQQSEIGIVDITGFNSNVLIELGMLYGFGKPVIIILNKKMDLEIKIPSNIRGIEQIRYTDFGDMKNKISYCINNVLSNKILIEKQVLDYVPMIRYILEDIQKGIFVKENKKLLCNIVDIKEINGIVSPIINLGKENDLRQGIIFDLFLLEKTNTTELIEQYVGSLKTIHVQDTISQCIIYEEKNNRDIWNQIRSNLVFNRPHVLKIHEPVDIEHETVDSLTKRLKIFKQILTPLSWR